MNEYEITLNIFYPTNTETGNWDRTEVKVKIKANSKQEALEALAESDVEPRGLK